ncbi:MAG: SPOR domain-containing protein [Bacteroidales bacterium]|nr:SPOR domain-containing protein [Bacteroidales bacterium]
MKESKVCRVKFLPGILSSSLGFSVSLSVIFILLSSTGLCAQDREAAYEISVNLKVPRVGGTEVEALIKGKELYLAVSELFDFLKLKNTPSPNFESVSGFFINPDNEYLIDRPNNRILYNGKHTDLNPDDLIRTESNLYLKSSYFGEIFGLNCIFNFRALSVTLETQLDVPLIREMRQEEIRKNLSRLRSGEKEADTLIQRTYPMFRFGMADWSAIATEQINGPSNGRLNLSLGAMILGGEATASLTYDTRQPFTEKQQYYLWRYVNNDNNFLRQVKAGKIPTYAHSTIYNPVVGAQVTNTPTTYRRSFGTYTLSDRTEPGWIVELYVNNVLVDYVEADASGFFTFEVPLVYGNTIVKLKFFGPWGEEQTREQNINIPFNFLPPGTLEYTVSGGIVEDGSASTFGRADVNYGLSKRISLGAGFEYLSSVTSTPFMPFINSSVRISNNLLLTGHYIHGVKAGGTMTYRLPSHLQFNIKYNKYDKDQEAINYNYLEERKASVSLPLRIGKFSSYNRISINQLILPNSDYTTGEWMFSGSLFGVNTNLTTYGIFIDDADPYIYSNLSLAFRLPHRLTIMPQVQYGFTRNEFISAKLRIEKHLLDHAFLNISFERNIRSNMNLAELGLRYNFSFAQTGASVRYSQDVTSLVQYARGSLINDGRTDYRRADNRPNVGRGGIIIRPFLDYNGNGKKDPGENGAPGLNLRANGGRVDKSEKDTLIAITGLEPYTSCFIELDPNSFYNIAWRLPYESLNVKVDPNIMKNIDIPVTIVGEAAGFVRLEGEDGMKGLGRIIVRYLNENKEIVASTLTEHDGYYSYFGLKPGKYFVMPDTAQMNKLAMQAEPDSIAFVIGQSLEGDIVGDLDFLIKIIKADTAEPDTIVQAEQEPETIIDSTYTVIHEVTEELITITEDSWAIQLGAFTTQKYAGIMRARLESLLEKKAEIVVEGDFYKVRILDLKDREEVDRTIERLKEVGFNIFWVIRLKALQEQRILKETEDSLLQVSETDMYADRPAITPDMSIQLGAFRNEAYAKAMVEKLRFRLDKELEIVREDGYHKVRLKGFRSVGEMERMIPALELLGVDDIWILPVPEGEAAAAREEYEPLSPAGIRDARLETAKPETSRLDTGVQINEPQFSLQVAVYPKRTQAMRAQRKIEKRLNLPVEIVEQWDYYRVIVTGFFTREETFRYYPELAGLGFDRIMLIDTSEK